MCAERYNNEAADQIVNDRTVLNCDVCDSRHAFRDLRWTLAPNEREHELDAALLDGLPLATEQSLDTLRVDEFLE